MQFGLKFFTLLALVALVGSTLGQPVANEQAAVEPILAKRWNQWGSGWPTQISFVNGHYRVNGQWPIGLINNTPYVYRQNQWYTFNRGWIAPGVTLPNFTGFNRLSWF
ncbi:uncharacterized protein MELLADRAFT_67605 [Melampsora larici-populina 98AG31]|uniref:Secreted protein n=1 Tax=Melampsora larici-populina (strain 98AG31 / pathotype 3-4-7) TaxID=747676 RepID=F4S3R7_MELLP|nr:uncharacterized protein MELLADRAFT_67606 [Melampsora larici-populina 98AG31]XP_007416021.1 uncharacterized protein MELLADRAFT_67605 [Melampsora larici-populina 98AG31]EGG00721.1 secreted protein [Melampsora larici-populina 98AG31]EGG00750.1 secreted protein [Melampsora larici-populina 98AG31]